MSDHHSTTIEATGLSEITSMKSSKRGPIFASVLGLLLAGGAIWHFAKGDADEAAPVEEQPVAVEEAPAPKPVEPAPVKEPAPAPLAERVMFALDDSKVGAASKASLDQWAERMATDKTMSAQIDGHCDERGTSAYNQRLGERRAVAVKGYLMRKGVDGQRLHTASYGESRPSVEGHGEAAWQENRRVELKAVKALSQR